MDERTLKTGNQRTPDEHSELNKIGDRLERLVYSLPPFRDRDYLIGQIRLACEESYLIGRRQQADRDGRGEALSDDQRQFLIAGLGRLAGSMARFRDTYTLNIAPHHYARTGNGGS